MQYALFFIPASLSGGLHFKAALLAVSIKPYGHSLASGAIFKHLDRPYLSEWLEPYHRFLLSLLIGAYHHQPKS